MESERNLFMKSSECVRHLGVVVIYSYLQGEVTELGGQGVDQIRAGQRDLHAFDVEGQRSD